MTTSITCTLAKGKEKQARSFHPWIFSGAIAHSTPRQSGPGIARVLCADGSFLAWAQYNPGSAIRLRLLSWEEGAYPDASWHQQRIEEALHARIGVQTDGTTACRLIFSESDGLPGLIVDRMGDTLVAQFLTATMDSQKEAIVESLAQLAPTLIPQPFTLRCILERSDGDGRKMEGLAASQGVLWGAAEEDTTEIYENGLPFTVNLLSQKTGFYTDQRLNRSRVAAWAPGARVLDACCYTGAFSAYAARAGAAAITLLDSSEEALALARQNVIRALHAAGRSEADCPIETICGDAFAELRKLRQTERRFDLVILDPPKLAPTRASLTRAAGAYKDLNLQALLLLEADGRLATFSCSGLVSAEDFQRWVAWAGKDSCAHARIVERLSQASCHPVPLAFPEAAYLKGLILQVRERPEYHAPSGTATT